VLEYALSPADVAGKLPATAGWQPFDYRSGQALRSPEMWNGVGTANSLKNIRSAFTPRHDCAMLARKCKTRSHRRKSGGVFLRPG